MILEKVKIVGVEEPGAGASAGGSPHSAPSLGTAFDTMSLLSGGRGRPVELHALVLGCTAGEAGRTPCPCPGSWAATGR